MKIGAQLYTVRQACTTLEGLSESLKKVADIGYTSVQLSGVCAYEADWMDAQLKACGLSADITHFDYNRIINDTAATIAFHDRMGCRYIGIGSLPGIFSKESTPTDLEARIDELTPAIKAIYASGNHKFMYHNHNREFARFGEQNFLELLCDRFTPDELGITLDTYWVQAGGADPAQWLHRLTGRVNCVHFKDMSFSLSDGAVRMAPIGEGNMNYDAILAACVDARVEYAYIEQDNCYDEDPFDCLRKSYAFLASKGFH